MVGVSSSSTYNRTAMNRLLLVFLASSLSSTVHAERIDLYIWAGQSNAVGAVWPPETNDLSPQSQVLYHPNVLTTAVHQATGWMDLQSLHPLWPQFSGATYGAELAFGHFRSQTSNHRIGIIKAAANSTTLATHWNPAISGSFYDWLKERVHTAISGLPAGLEPNIAGFIWIQGESDAGLSVWADAYHRNLQSLIDSVRRDFGNPSLPFLMPLLHPDVQAPKVSKVRAAQLAVARANRGILLVDNDDQELLPDGFHYTNEMHMETGSQFASFFDFGNQFLRQQREGPVTQSRAVPEPTCGLLIFNCVVVFRCISRKPAIE